MFIISDIDSIKFNVVYSQKFDHILMLHYSICKGINFWAASEIIYVNIFINLILIILKKKLGHDEVKKI